MADANVTKKKGNKVLRFLKDCKAEVKKVTWPDRKQLIHNTGIILVFIAIVTVVLSLLDAGFAKLFQLLTNLL
ncbi:MAG TPA: preprotein translocase subunit SecE [Candidatus Ornithomonoglobus intestinigallinarum]|uniref:Protein translocase subunit SecE n=1 Tax=Candidatus Ornithomonoglobus intestinigallinarum TaxID=2840894 RepID=A0A9D1KPM4_9FIRM|nr:preprotein translocase subunit SecE [Candidatus Ornithomonoglobus intestinigallinarum]